jgi:hypothetical protein
MKVKVHFSKWTSSARALIFHMISNYFSFSVLLCETFYNIIYKNVIVKIKKLVINFMMRQTHNKKNSEQKILV